jgi:hypothetical protein
VGRTSGTCEQEDQGKTLGCIRSLALSEIQIIIQKGWPHLSRQRWMSNMQTRSSIIACPPGVTVRLLELAAHVAMGPLWMKSVGGGKHCRKGISGEGRGVVNHVSETDSTGPGSLAYLEIPIIRSCLSPFVLGAIRSNELPGSSTVTMESP